MAVNKELAALVTGFTDEEITQPISTGRPRRDQIIHGMIAHNSYHACEIITIRHMLGLWLERT